MSSPMLRLPSIFAVFATFSLVALALGCASGAGDGGGHVVAPGPIDGDPAALAPGESLEAFLRTYPFLDEEKWLHFDVEPSGITSTRRRIFFEKDAVATALLTYRGGRGDESSPMEYPRGTVFVARALDEDGGTLDTEIMITRAGEVPDFLVFDHHGEPTEVFIRPVGDPNGRRAAVPQACINCHVRPRAFHPTFSYPDEATEHKMILPEAWRDARAVAWFQEAQRRGEALFGPYGAVLMGKLRADAAAGTLSEDDAVIWEALQEKFPELTGPPAERGAEPVSLLDGNPASD